MLRVRNAEGREWKFSSPCLRMTARNRLLPRVFGPYSNEIGPTFVKLANPMVAADLDFLRQHLGQHRPRSPAMAAREKPSPAPKTDIHFPLP